MKTFSSALVVAILTHSSLTMAQLSPVQRRQPEPVRPVPIKTAPVAPTGSPSGTPTAPKVAIPIEPPMAPRQPVPYERYERDTSRGRRGYDGPGVDVGAARPVDRRHLPVDHRGGGNCENYLRDESPKALLIVCNFGQGEAQRIAMRFASQNGRVDGYLRGYAWGLHKGIELYRNDPSEIERGAQMIDQSRIEAARSQAAAEARDAASSQGRTDAISRFKALMETENPVADSRVQVPVTQYHPMDNAYQTFFGSLPDERDLIRTEVRDPSFSVYGDWDRTYGERQPMQRSQLWSRDGNYEFERGHGMSADEALRLWQSNPNEGRRAYEALQTDLQYTDRAGRVVTVNLQQIFQEAFKNVYPEYAAAYYYHSFDPSLDDGANEGELDGARVGRREAQLTGQMHAFDEMYRSATLSAYDDSYRSTYTQAFVETFNHYDTHAILSFTFDGIQGKDNDGILQAGETVSATFTVRNEGGIATDISASLKGDVGESRSEKFRIGKLQTKTFTAKELGRISSGLPVHSRARLGLVINGEEHDLEAYIQKGIEIPAASARLTDVSNGAGEVHATITNVTTRPASSVSVNLYVDGIPMGEAQHLDPIAGGASREVVLPILRMDPLALLAGNHQAKVVASMNGSVMDDHQSLTLAAPDLSRATITYFNDLANGRGLTGTAERSDRLNEVINQIVNLNAVEMRDHKDHDDIWADGGPNSVVGRLAMTFRSENQSEVGIQAYETVASRVWDERTHLGRVWRYLSAKRKHYNGLVQAFARGEYKD